MRFCVCSDWAVLYGSKYIKYSKVTMLFFFYPSGGIGDSEGVAILLSMIVRVTPRYSLENPRCTSDQETSFMTSGRPSTRQRMSAANSYTDTTRPPCRASETSLSAPERPARNPSHHNHITTTSLGGRYASRAQ